MTRIGIIAVCIALASGPSYASGNGLADETDINEALVMMAAADKIRRACNSIGGRLFKAQKFAGDLKEAARARGYSDAEIDAYLGSKAERAKVRARRNVYFETQGASNLDPQSLCVLGHAEIARKSQIGAFLRAK